ncbi:unnamed protein product [Didymodactylos carnosus]|uniref:Uncharacterized protein n=1 Tax=Didymodactylos carnosus TaxID=1234261 RepID=A0A814QG05_9BILA|nr:unnamed protein product [Didymodactylos carnosus]CAF1119496.1 unnamed protein product [Didymodactylos carnosus]CAF3828470.1 unnamed protein product [Didymodactylos carnosus]CAF3883140.1 unnamed protein product [Didymodactylos carnosus]
MCRCSVVVSVTLLLMFISIAKTDKNPFPNPPVWPTVWMSHGSGYYLFNNETICASIYYDWSIPAQVMNLMRSDSISFTILNVKDVVWRLERANRTCCIDPNQTGVTPPRPDWLQGNYTVYDGIVNVMEHECNSWTKNVPDVATFSWLTSVKTSVPCRLGWLDAVHFDFSYFSTNPNLLPTGIFDIPSYCPFKITDPNCSIMHF